MTLGEIAALVGGELEGASPDTPITGVAPAGAAMPGDLTFFANPRYLPALRASRATAALVPPDFAETIAVAPLSSRSGPSQHSIPSHGASGDKRRCGR